MTLITRTPILTSTSAMATPHCKLEELVARVLRSSHNPLEASSTWLSRELTRDSHLPEPRPRLLKLRLKLTRRQSEYTRLRPCVPMLCKSNSPVMSADYLLHTEALLLRDKESRLLIYGCLSQKAPTPLPNKLLHKIFCLNLTEWLSKES